MQQTETVIEEESSLAPRQLLDETEDVPGKVAAVSVEISNEEPGSQILIAPVIEDQLKETNQQEPLPNSIHESVKDGEEDHVDDEEITPFERTQDEEVHQISPNDSQEAQAVPEPPEPVPEDALDEPLSLALANEPFVQEKYLLEQPKSDQLPEQPVVELEAVEAK